MKVVVKDNQLKKYHARNGYNKIFGMDVDERKEMSEEQLIERFDDIWHGALLRAIVGADKCSALDAKKKLRANQRQYFVDTQEHREFLLEQGLFIAQLQSSLSEELELTQLWFVRSSDSDPRVLYIRFDTASEREEFRKLAQNLRWVDEELGKRLVLDFMELTLNKSFGRPTPNSGASDRQKSENVSSTALDEIAEKYGL